jgi:hypothetical protein
MAVDAYISKIFGVGAVLWQRKRGVTLPQKIAKQANLSRLLIFLSEKNAGIIDWTKARKR